MLVKEYSIKKYPFVPIIEGFFDNKSLPFLHKLEHTIGKTDQGTSFHETIYRLLDFSFYQVYDAFIEEVVDSLEDTEWSVQKTPTFRVQLPGRKGTKEFHRDRDYQHPKQTLNVVVPLTPMRGTTAILLEKAPYTDIYDKAVLDVGQYMLFDGANVKHGTLLNEEGYTRVSFDFRLVPTQYAPSEGQTVTQRVPFKEYYRNI